MKTKVEFAKSHKDLENFSPDEMEMVRQFKISTGLNVPTCVAFLRNYPDGLLKEFENDFEVLNKFLLPVKVSFPFF